MKIYIGADNRGVDFKSRIKNILNDLNVEVDDVGTFDEGVSCDYPIIAYKVAKQVVLDPNHRGILICMSGIGQTIAANKVAGARAALCYNKEAAVLSRQHNDANILVISSKFVPESQLVEVVQAFLNSEFEGGRHQRRVDLMSAIERGEDISSE